jgi:cytochrome oxidase assembly protein ShyY1
VFRALGWTLRQRRYAALATGALVFALICIGMGTFEIHRYQEKVRDNSTLRDNAHAPVTSLTTSLVPLTGNGGAPSGDAINYRHVTVTGSYVADREQYVADQTQHGRQGFYVLTPMRADGAIVLVVRGFIAATSDETRPADVPAAPTGVVRVTGWLQPPQTTSDDFGRLGHGEITSINAAEQAGRLDAPVYQASLTLAAKQPGTAGLSTVPLPDLGNPTGGAADWQLLSYVIQWYAFAVLALLMPFLVSRGEVREARRRYLGIDEGAQQIDAGAGPRELAGAATPGEELVVRGGGELALRAEIARRVERAARLADRYGQSLGLDAEDALAASQAAATPAARQPIVRDSSAAVHRSADEYHASYNDYLWQLALADGGLPDGDEHRGEPRRIEAASRPDDEAAPGGEGPVP